MDLHTPRLYECSINRGGDTGLLLFVFLIIAVWRLFFVLVWD